MTLRKFLLCLLPLLAGAAHAQDEQRVVSPSGQLEFRLFTVLPEGAGLNTLAYRVLLHGKPLIDTSFLGLNIHFQEPFLGENLGLSSSTPTVGANYRGLLADYLQNSSTGRRIALEIRVWDDGVAFRYVLRKQWPLLDLLIEDEGTEFHFANAADRPAQASLPYSEVIPGGGWLGIFESRVADFPATSLVRTGAKTMITHLPDRPGDPGVAYIGVTPWTGPWRILAIGTNRDDLAKSDIVRALTK